MLDYFGGGDHAPLLLPSWCVGESSFFIDKSLAQLKFDQGHLTELSIAWSLAQTLGNICNYIHI